MINDPSFTIPPEVVQQPVTEVDLDKAGTVIAELRAELARLQLENREGRLALEQAGPQRMKLAAYQTMSSDIAARVVTLETAINQAISLRAVGQDPTDVLLAALNETATPRTDA